MSTSAAQNLPLRWGQLRPSTKLWFLLIFLLFLTGFLELGSRVYWAAIKHTRGTNTDAIWRTFYPEATESGIDAVSPFHGDAEVQVLLLGGSVVHPKCGNIGDALGSALEAKLGRKVRIVNFSYPGRTSLDSRSKYEHFADKRFDLVVVYHGINDVYLNNCPPEGFRRDYSHAYRLFGAQYDLKSHPEVGAFALPFTATYLGNSLLVRWGLTYTPRGVYERFGNDIRTPPSFEDNLEAIARIAEQRGETVVLSTFAYYIPSNYSNEAFFAKKLDYASHMCAASTWAEASNLGRTIDLHNEAARRVAMRHGLTLIDQRANMPDGKRYYNDPCHLTDDGCARWVENVMSGLDVSRIGNADYR